MHPPTKRLYRSSRDSRVAGVCAGLGDFFGLDPVLIRLVWIVVTVFTGFLPGALVYLLAWVVIPEEPGPEPVQRAADRPEEHNAQSA